MFVGAGKVYCISSNLMSNEGRKNERALVQGKVIDE